jgi:hypothetical protein
MVGSHSARGILPQGNIGFDMVAGSMRRCLARARADVCSRGGRFAVADRMQTVPTKNQAQDDNFRIF